LRAASADCSVEAFQILAERLQRPRGVFGTDERRGGADPQRAAAEVLHDKPRRSRSAARPRSASRVPDAISTIIGTSSR